ncbi:MAG: dTDP-4-dehydrorhamnose 3,5-epimerase, partial [Thermoanaerobaculia bacterium]|nr:dTDP-4-dehydrorhamnose 3,5-epimerase [Thermoanaerobaculia bacterium]
MKTEALALPGLLLLEPRVFTDDRGHFFESYNERDFRHAGIDERFVQDNQSRSHRGVLRGLHAQLENPQGKLVRVVCGTILDVAVDIRPDSATFGRWEAVRLDADAPSQLWVPPGFAHGFVALAEPTVVLYKCTALYDADDEIGIRWDDPDLAIDWPVRSPVLSDKDAALPTLAELEP